MLEGFDLFSRYRTDGGTMLDSICYPCSNQKFTIIHQIGVEYPTDTYIDSLECDIDNASFLIKGSKDWHGDNRC